jgi:acetylornithine/succinyldiaminopimelate/putrescine aminotransferase
VDGDVDLGHVDEALAVLRSILRTRTAPDETAAVIADEVQTGWGRPAPRRSVHRLMPPLVVSGDEIQLRLLAYQTALHALDPKEASRCR